MVQWLSIFCVICLAPVAAWSKTAAYALILSEPPLAERVQNRTQLKSAGVVGQRQAISLEQESLRQELSRQHIQVTGSVQTLLNAVFVRVPEGAGGGLKYIPGVKIVAYLPPLRRHLNRALDLTQVPGAWNLVGGVGNAGAGVKIAIIDTGIDQNHPAFQDSSLSVPPGFPRGNPSFTNSKVIAAHSYVSELALPDDNTPRDRVGHGTAMAMIAAGGRVTGPAATITGVAPKAWLGNYKIYGSPGVNEFTSDGVIVEALEDALADGMDIAAIASGAAALYGPLEHGSFCPKPTISRSYIPADACDVRAQAVENAIHMGMTVVVSAGDDGANGFNFPTLGTIDTPGTAPSAITVGASTNSHIFYSTVGLNGGAVPSNLRQIDAMTGEGPKPGSPLTAPLRDVSQLGNDGLACSVLNSGSLNGAIALIERGTCAFDVKVNNAQAAGAVAVLLYLAAGEETTFVATQVGDTAIPLFTVGNTAGVAIQSFLKSNSNTTATLDPALHAEDAPFDTVAEFSSRGPAIGALSIKPELVAVGTDLYTATQTYDPNSSLYDPTGYTSVTGTSFAVPLVAGAAALVKQAHPGYGPAQLKSAVVNTATNNINDDSGLARVTSVGAGKLNAAGAVAASVTVDPATVSFGAVSTAAGTLPINRTLNVTNTGANAAIFTVSVAPRDTDNNARVGVSPGSLSLNPGQSGTVMVRLDGNRPNAGSYEGQINISGNGANLHVPYLYLAGDGVPQNIFELPMVSGNIGFRLIDRFGVPVPNIPVRFRVVSGGGSITQADANTDVDGNAAALIALGPQAGDQFFAADAGGLTQEFDVTALLQPAIPANGVVGAGDSDPGRALAPGSYITIYGANLSPTTRSFVTTYLPISLVGVSVGFNVPSAGIGVPGRVSYVSASQINVQIPWELQGQTSTLLTVTNNGVSSAQYTLPLAAYAPAFVAAGSAQRGQPVSIYANGLGPVDNQPASGEPSPTPPAQPLASTRVTPSVTIAGRPAQVLFSGLAPGFVGLYQINVIVPSDAPTGAQPIVITTNGIDSKTSNLIVN
ncbi:MAG: S8 family serine peptidase [Bryobacteraceae bacterium]